MTCNPSSAGSHKHIIVVVDYFTKWVEAMPILNCKVETATQFFFNHVIARFGVPLQLVSYHSPHFEDANWMELSSMLKFEHQYSSAYYPQINGQVGAVNNILKSMLQRMVEKHKTKWHHLLFFSL